MEQLPESIREAGEMMPGFRRADARVDADEEDTHAGTDAVTERWEDSWRGTTDSFRNMNTVEAWRSASEQARVPLGAVVSRADLSRESVPGPPSGYVVVKFRTSFANRASATETLSLAREGETWRVVGYYID